MAGIAWSSLYSYESRTNSPVEELRADGAPRAFEFSAVLVLFLVGDCKIVAPL